MTLVVTCGYNSSLHTIILLDLLKRDSIQVNKCLIVSTFSLKRTKAYYRQLDKAEFVKKVKDRILGNIIKTQLSDEVKYVTELHRKLNIKEKKVSEYCKNNKILYQIVKDLNSDETKNFIGEADLGIYSGGGILKKKFLDLFRIGVLNCHGGKLPEVRGMNSAEWSILLNIPLQNTLHFMERKLDMGPILMSIKHDYSKIESIDQLRGTAINYAVSDILKGVKKVLTGNYTTIPQQLKDGKQFFTMHPVLKSIVNKKLRRNAGKSV